MSGAFWASIDEVGGKGLAFLFSILLARILLPEEFGLIAALSIFIGVGTLLLNAGLSSSLIRSEHVNEEDYSTVFIFNLFGGVVVYAVIFFAAPLIAKFYRQEILVDLVRVLSLSIIVHALGAIQFTRYTKAMNFKTLALIRLPTLLVSAMIGLFMAMNGYGVWSLVMQLLSSSILKTIFLWIFSDWRPTWTFNKLAFKTHFNFGYKLTLSGLINVIFNEIYVILIGRFFPMAQVGYYQRAHSLGNTPSTALSTIVQRVSFPLMSTIQNEETQLKSVYKKIFQLIIFVIAPILITAGVLAEPLFRFVLTEKWLPAVPYFQILVANAVLLPVHAFNLEIVNVKGRSDLFLKAEVAKKIILLIVIAIAFQFGIYGLLYGSVVVSIFSLVVNIFYAAPQIDYGFKEQMSDLLPAIGMALFAGAIVYFIDGSTKVYLDSDVLRILIGGAISMIIYLLLAQAFKLSAFKEIKGLIKLRA